MLSLNEMEEEEEKEMKQKENKKEELETASIANSGKLLITGELQVSIREQETTRIIIVDPPLSGVDYCCLSSC